MKVSKQNYNKKNISFIVFVFLISLGLSNLYAADYYVSSTDGNDNNDGLSAANPWQSLTKVREKAVLAQGFQAGDKILFKRGDTWEGQLRVFGKCGTESNPITFSTYGEGENPIIYGDYHSLNWTPVAGHPGIFSAYAGELSVITQGYDGSVALTEISKSIYDLTDPIDLDNFLDTFTLGSFGPYGGNNSTGMMYVKTFDGNSPDSDYRLFVSGGIRVEYNSAHIIFENLDIRNSITGVLIDHGTSIIIRNNSIQNTLKLGILVRYDSSDCLIEDNTIINTGSDALYMLKADGTIFRGNAILGVVDNVLGITTEGDQCAIGLQESTNALVEYNYGSNILLGSCVDFYRMQGAIVQYNYFENCCRGITPGGLDITVRYNIINMVQLETQPLTWGRGLNAANGDLPGTGDILVYNNIFYGTGRYGMQCTGRVRLYNNIVCSNPNVSNAMFVLFTGDDITSQNNCFYGPAKFSDAGTEYDTLSSFQSATGYEANSMVADPCFAFNALPQKSSDFQLMASSPCINVGYDLTSIVNEYLDFIGIAVPQSSAPDIGAYEGEVLLYDNLEGEIPNTEPSQWTPIQQDLDYLVKVDAGNNVLSLSGATYSYARIMASSASNQWEDYEMKFNFKYVGTNENICAYILFLYEGVNNPDAYMRIQTGRTYATLQYMGTINGQRPTFSSGESSLYQSYSSVGFDYSLSADTWYQVRITADGQTDEVAVYICKVGDDENEVELFNTPVVLTEGGAGLAVWTNEVYFDDIQIKKLPH